MAVTEGVVLNGLNLNPETVGTFHVEKIDFSPPKKRTEWAQANDSDGGDLIRTPLYENRTVTMSVRVDPQSTENAALVKVGELVDMLQEAEKNPGGIPLEWTPASSTKTITFYVLSGEVTGIPITIESGWLVKAPLVDISLTCKPFGYGAEEEVLAAKSNETGLSVVTATISGVKGDVPAEGRLVVTDSAAVGRRFVEWGVQNRYYDAATSLIRDNEEMTAVGGAPSEAANTGAYKPSGTKGTIATTLFPEPTICCNTGTLKHVGVFRVKARVQAVSGGEGIPEQVHVRMSYQDGESPFRANDWQSPPVSGKFVEVDLGQVSLTEKVTGTQKWVGQIEAYSENVAAKDVLHVDYLTFIPILEGYGKAHGPTVQQAGTIVDYDNFTTGTLSGSLGGRTPALGAPPWETKGAATDWTVTANSATRSTELEAGESGRFALIGSALGNSSVATSHWVSSTISTGASVKLGAALRYVNETNYAVAYVSLLQTGWYLQLLVKVAGVPTYLASTYTAVTRGPSSTVAISFTATLDGALSASATVDGKTQSVAATHKSIIGGEALQSGKPGTWDQYTGKGFVPRLLSSLSAKTLPALPYCIQPSRAMEFRSDSTLTADSSGTYYGPSPQSRGSRFFLPQAGEANRTSRILVKADRNDLAESDQQTIADAFNVKVYATPRYSVIPR